VQDNENYFVTEDGILVHNGYGDSAKVENPPGTKRNSEGQLIDEKTGKYLKDPNTVEYNRNMAERRKTLLRDAKDSNSGLTNEARAYIIENNGNKVPPGYEVSHEIPLYTEKTIEGKQGLDMDSNMKTEKEIPHRKTHQKCGTTYHAFPPADYRGS
jgi:hypothetical protein